MFLKIFPLVYAGDLLTQHFAEEIRRRAASMATAPELLSRFARPPCEPVVATSGVSDIDPVVARSSNRAGLSSRQQFDSSRVSSSSDRVHQTSPPTTLSGTDLTVVDRATSSDTRWHHRHGKHSTELITARRHSESDKAVSAISGSELILSSVKNKDNENETDGGFKPTTSQLVSPANDSVRPTAIDDDVIGINSLSRTALPVAAIGSLYPPFLFQQPMTTTNSAELLAQAAAYHRQNGDVTSSLDLLRHSSSLYLSLADQLVAAAAVNKLSAVSSLDSNLRPTLFHLDDPLAAAAAGSLFGLPLSQLFASSHHAAVLNSWYQSLPGGAMATVVDRRVPAESPTVAPRSDNDEDEEVSELLDVESEDQPFMAALETKKNCSLSVGSDRSSRRTTSGESDSSSSCRESSAVWRPY